VSLGDRALSLGPSGAEAFGGSTHFVSSPAEGVEHLLGSAKPKVAWVSRTASMVFGRALNFRAAFLAIVAAALSYGTALLIVVYAYRRGYGIVGKAHTRAPVRGKKPGDPP
jgi:hypothetical protein